MSQLQTEIFDKLGMKTGTPRETSNGLELPAICPFHSDRYMGNFFINLNSGLYHCFSCNAKGVIYELPLKNGVNIGEFRRAWNLLKQDQKLTDFRLNPDLVRYYSKKSYSSYAQFERKMDLDTLKSYSIYEDDNLNPIFFVRDWQNETVALWMRYEESYLLLEPLDSKTQGHLFGMHLLPSEKNVLTEGFFDAMSVYQDTGHKSVCGNGVFLTAKQIENLKKLQPLYVMLDGDAAGRRGRDRLFEQLYDMEVYFCGGYDCDPDELSKERKFEVLESAKSRMEYSEIYEKNSR